MQGTVLMSMPPRKVRLFYLAPSHYCEKARKVLEFKGIPFEQVNVPYGDHTEVIAASGQDYVPYVDVPGEKGVTWPDICDWAERTKPTPTLYPGKDPKATRAQARVVEHWAHQVVEEMTWRYALSDIPPKLSAGRERWIFVEMQERKRGPIEVMAMRKPEFLAGVKEVCGIAQDALGTKPYLLGDEPSLADFALYGALHPLKFSGHEIPKDFGKLRSWHERVDAA